MARRQGHQKTNCQPLVKVAFSGVIFYHHKYLQNIFIFCQCLNKNIFKICQDVVGNK